MKRLYQIGETISWKAGNLKCKGIVRDDMGEVIEVMCVEVNGSPTKRMLKINKDIVVC